MGRPSGSINRKYENIAAVSAEFHQDKKLFRQFYDNHAESLGGFPGIWCYCVDLGLAFTSAENKFKRAMPMRDESYYLDAIIEFVHKILVSGECPTFNEAECLAFSTIAKCSV